MNKQVAERLAVGTQLNQTWPVFPVCTPLSGLQLALWALPLALCWTLLQDLAVLSPHLLLRLFSRDAFVLPLDPGLCLPSLDSIPASA
jgi:hypothetical protein